MFVLKWCFHSALHLFYLFVCTQCLQALQLSEWEWCRRPLGVLHYGMEVMGGWVQLPYGNHRKGAPVGSITFLERQERQRKETRKRKQHESLIIRHKHQQCSSKKIGNVSLNWTLNPHLQTFSLFSLKSLSFCRARLAKTVKG